MRMQFCLALLVSGLFVWGRVDAASSWREDYYTYLPEPVRVGIALARGQGWQDSFGPGTGPTAHVAPVYPVLLAGVYRVFGMPESPTGRWAQHTVSLALALGGLLLLPVLAVRLGFPVGVGWAAAFLAAWLPFHRIKPELDGCHEQVAVTLGLLALLLVLANARTSLLFRHTRVLLGLVTGIVALISPNLVLVPFLFLGLEFLARPRQRGELARTGLVVGLVAGLVITPWLIRNVVVLGGFCPVRSNFGLELAVGNRPGATGYTYAPGFKDIHPFGSEDVRHHLQAVGELAFMHEKQRQAHTWIAANPGTFAGLTLRRAQLFWFTCHLETTDSQGRMLRPVRHYLTLGVGALVSLGWLLRASPTTGRLLLSAILGVGLPHFITHMEERYRYPVVGLFALLNFALVWAVVRAILSWRIWRPAESQHSPALPDEMPRKLAA
jgi:hypothetical protein